MFADRLRNAESISFSPFLVRKGEEKREKKKKIGRHSWFDRIFNSLLILGSLGLCICKRA